MKTTFGCKELGSWLLMGALLCSLQMAMASPAQSRRKAVKKAPPPDLFSGNTGPVQQIPLDSIAAVAPQVTYENDELTIVAPNSTLADILRAVKKLTGAEIDVPAAPERVVTRLGPGPARDIVAELLNGSRFNYVLLGAPNDQAALSRVVLVAKTGSQEITPNAAPAPEPSQAVQQQPNFSQQQPETPVDANGGFGDPSEDNATPEENPADQNGNEAEQPPQENPGVKTPQQMLQEMQQRQMQLQQQQPPGQPPIPGSGMPPHPPQEP